MVIDIDGFVETLAGAKSLERHRVGQWQCLRTGLWPDYVDSKARVLDRPQEGIKLEVADVLRTWRDDIRRIQVVPHICNLANGDPMVSLVRNEALFLGNISLVIS